MFIQSEVNADNAIVLNLKGKWITPPVFARLRSAALYNTHNGAVKYTADEQAVNGPVVTIEFCKSLGGEHVLGLIRRLRDHLAPVIGSAFTSISVSPYHVPDNNNENGLGLLMEIADETGCDVDYGSWNSPVTFRPTTSTQYNEVVDLLETFQLNFN